MANPQNTRRINESITGEEIAKLNEVSPGLGNKLHRLLSTFGSSLAAQAGHKGSVGVVKQKTKNQQGIIDPALTLQQDRIAGVDDPIDDLDAVNLRTLRRLLGQLTEDEDAIPVNPLKEVCRPIAMSNGKSVDTGLTVGYAVEVLNEFVYCLGLDGTDGVLEIYTLHGDNEMTLTSRLVLTEEPSQMVLQGHYIYACKVVLFTSPDFHSNNLTIIDVKMPDAPVEVVRFNVGAATNGLHVQGRYAYVACNASIKIVDVSVPTAPIVVGTA